MVSSQSLKPWHREDKESYVNKGKLKSDLSKTLLISSQYNRTLVSSLEKSPLDFVVMKISWHDNPAPAAPLNLDDQELCYRMPSNNSIL